MTTENVRIAVRDAQDSQTLAFMDNSAPNAIHFDQADLTRFFEGDSTVLQMRFNKKHDRANVIREGSKLAFVYKGKDYWLNIITAKDVSHQRELMAFSLSLELNKEKVGFYAANTAMAFVEYLKSIDFEQTLTIGINEIADKKLKLDWDGDQSKLGRLYSLANKFDAEISFETILNDDYSLKQQIINIYKKHDESNQGIGQDKTATTLRVGKDLKVINRSASLENFYSAIRGTGKDGISINDIEFEELDANGNVLYFSKKGQDVIWAPQARDAFPSKNNPGNDGYLVEKKGETEYTTVEALKGYLLSELKKNSSVYVDYETEGHFDSDPGDTFSLEDSVYYSPPLYLEARVYEQTESLVLGDFSSDKTTFSNFVEKTSEVDSSLLSRVQALIEANKAYNFEILTSSGIIFKNGIGSTTLTARVRDGIKEITDTFSLKWYKDGTLFSNTKTVTINAADIEEKAVFRFEVADDSGNVRGGAEVTVTNIDDGKEGEPGKAGETYYPHKAWKMADGTFAPNYPNDNLLTNSRLSSTKDWGFGGGLTYELKEGGEILLIKTANTGSRTFFSQNIPLASIKRNTQYSIYIEIFVESASGANVGNTEVFLRTVANGPYIDSPKVSIDLTKINQWQVLQITGTSYDGQLTAAQFTLAISQDVVARIRVRKPKLAEGTTAFPYTPKPSEDYENAYPKYEGFYSDTNQVGSDNPDDYKPWTPFMGPQGGQGPKGDSAPLISLSGATQAITVDKDGKITPASSFAVIGTAVNTVISNWTYSLNGGNFGSAVPTGVTRSGNTVTINPVTATFDQLTIKAADATVSDVFTISRIKDGGEGTPGADAYTVFLTNESYTFAGSTTAALAGSTTTQIVVYKGTSKIDPTAISVGTMPTGMTSTVSGLGTAIITFTVTTAMTSKSGTVPITITADGKTFTKQFAYSISFQGGKGDKGDKGNTGDKGDKGDTGDTGKGVAAEEISYSISQDGVNPPTSGWSGTRPTPKAGWYMWTRTRFKYTDNTYSAYFYLVAQQGNDAIVISDTAPANPTKGTLWQDSSVVPQIIKVFDGTAWSMWGMPIDNLLATNILSENGVFKRLEGAEIVNTFSYTDSGVTYTGTTTMKDGNVTISRTGSDGSTWTTTMDRVQGFVDTYKSGPSAPSRVTQLGQGKLYMVESGVGGYLPAAALNPASWTNLSYASGFTTAENNPCQYRKVQLVDGSWELQLRGQIKPTSGDFSTTASPTGGILPAGFRPTRNELVPAADSTKRGARVVVLATGEIQINTPNGGNYVSFGGIRIAL